MLLFLRSYNVQGAQNFKQAGSADSWSYQP